MFRHVRRRDSQILCRNPLAHTRRCEDGESRESVGMRAARIRSNIADVYGVICGELASPSSGLNSAISGKENSLIKLGQLYRPVSLLSGFLSFPCFISTTIPSFSRARPAPFPSTTIPLARRGWQSDGERVARRRIATLLA